MELHIHRQVFKNFKNQTKNMSILDFATQTQSSQFCVSHQTLAIALLTLWRAYFFFSISLDDQ